MGCVLPRRLKLVDYQFVYLSLKATRLGSCFRIIEGKTKGQTKVPINTTSQEVTSDFGVDLSLRNAVSKTPKTNVAPVRYSVIISSPVVLTTQ
jgi:hypothetical protein